jgi:hypothetical protein
MAMVKTLWSINALATELDRDRRTVAKALANMPADGRLSGKPAWFLDTALRALRADGRDSTRDQDPLLSIWFKDLKIGATFTARPNFDLSIETFANNVHPGAKHCRVVEGWIALCGRGELGIRPRIRSSAELGNRVDCGHKQSCQHRRGFTTIAQALPRTARAMRGIWRRRRGRAVYRGGVRCPNFSTEEVMHNVPA